MSTPIQDLYFSRLFCRKDHLLFVLSYVFAFLVQCCDVLYDFRMETILLIFGSSCLYFLSYLRYLYLLAYSGVQHILTIWVKWWGVLKEAGCFGLHPSFWWSVPHLFSFLWFFLFFVPNVASFCVLSILYFPFGFL